MATRVKKNQRAIYRSAKTGRVVTEAYAKRHPSTTVRECRAVLRRVSRSRSE